MLFARAGYVLGGQREKRARPRPNEGLRPKERLAIPPKDHDLRSVRLSTHNCATLAQYALNPCA